uniref:hypothetical protein n=1 Tax=Halovivax sp. TaxID=1935978 RepID=UPI0025C11638
VAFAATALRPPSPASFGPDRVAAAIRRSVTDPAEATALAALACFALGAALNPGFYPFGFLAGLTAILIYVGRMQGTSSLPEPPSPPRHP